MAEKKRMRFKVPLPPRCCREALRQAQLRR
jgi:hypothetical protein